MGSGSRAVRKAFVQGTQIGLHDPKDFWRLFATPSKVKPKHLNNQQWRARQRQLARIEARSQQTHKAAKQAQQRED